MADQSHETPAKQSRTPLWRDRRVWSIFVALAILITYLSDNKRFLKDTETASFGVAGYIDTYFTPGSFLADFEARASRCDYHWLFVCENPPAPVCKPGLVGALLCPPAKDDHSVFDPDRYSPGVGDYGIVGRFWSGILILGALPDMTWYVIEKDYKKLQNGLVHARASARFPRDQYRGCDTRTAGRPADRIADRRADLVRFVLVVGEIPCLDGQRRGRVFLDPRCHREPAQPHRSGPRLGGRCAQLPGFRARGAHGARPRKRDPTPMKSSAYRAKQQMKAVIVAEPEGKVKSFLVCYDYGQGGIWLYLTAESSEEIRHKYPSLTVFDSPPPFWTDESEASARKADPEKDKFWREWLEQLRNESAKGVPPGD
jgi:hypothetical protein